MRPGITSDTNIAENCGQLAPAVLGGLRAIESAMCASDARMPASVTFSRDPAAVISGKLAVLETANGRTPAMPVRLG